MDYLLGRQNIVQGQAAELNAKLAAIALNFEETWLADTGDHPLQLLWRRQDALATNELLNFGDAVERLHQESPTWLKGQVRAIKNGDSGQSAGAIFEILALNLYSRDFCEVIPAPASKPGFDGTLKLRDGARVLVSVKNHGQSTREQDFLREAKAFDDEFQAQLAIHALRDLEINVLAAECLNAGAFQTLKSDIAHCLAELKAGKCGGALERPYTISIRSMADQYGPLSSFAVSSGCRVIAPIAPNEQANFEEAIRKGCENLYKHTKKEVGDVCRMIILRLSNTASIAKCREWAEWYFKEYPDDPADIVLLYQPSVTTDMSADTSSIVHYVEPILGRRFSTWQKRDDGSHRLLPSMSFFVGLIGTAPAPMLLTGAGGASIDISNYYTYQRADAYKMVEFKEGAIANLSNPASGILIHAIIEQNGAPGMHLSMKAEREKILALLP